jgi:hypothetical protein
MEESGKPTMTKEELLEKLSQLSPATRVQFLEQYRLKQRMKRGEWNPQEIAAMKSDDDEPSDVDKGDQRPTECGS